MSGESEAFAADLQESRAIIERRKQSNDRTTLARLANWAEQLHDEVTALRALRDSQ